MSLPLSESYIRQGDFVAIYSEQSPLTFGYQVYFCLKPTTDDLMVIELWLSVQTSTLESHPQLRLSFDAGPTSLNPLALQKSPLGKSNPKT